MSLPQLQRTWEVDEVEVELQSALDVVDKLQPPDDLRAATFTLAAQLLTQRAQVQAAVLPDLGALVAEAQRASR